MKILLIIGILITNAILMVQYIRTRAKMMSFSEFHKEAEKHALKMKFKDPVIVCDYCGAKINTAKNKSCPKCGAPYGNDSEFKARFHVNDAEIERQAAETFDRKDKESYVHALKSLKLIRGAIIALWVALLGIFGLILLGDKLAPKHTYLNTEELNEYSYETYNTAELQPEGEPVIVEDGNVKVTLTGIYESERNTEEMYTRKHFKVGVHMVNKREEPVSICLACIGVNGYVGDSEYFFEYGWLRKGADIVVYEEIYVDDIEHIYEMVMGKREICTEDKVLYSETDTIKTLSIDPSFEKNVEFPREKLLYENEYVKVFYGGYDEEEDRYKLCIENLSEHNYVMKSDGVLMDEKATDSWGIPERFLPAGYTACFNRVGGYADEYENRKKDAVINMSLNFSDKEAPEENFSTGYFWLNGTPIQSPTSIGGE